MSRDPTGLAVTFLRLVEERRMDEAEALLADTVTIVYPPGTRYGDLRSCVADRSGRYRSIRKEIVETHVAHADGSDHVYVSGTLHGEADDGSPIRDVRFVDRLTVRDGRITHHEVWNDLAAH